MPNLDDNGFIYTIDYTGKWDGTDKEKTPEMIECPECKGEGNLGRCDGDCYHGPYKACGGMDEGECEDGYLTCHTCEGEEVISLDDFFKIDYEYTMKKAREQLLMKNIKIKEI